MQPIMRQANNSAFCRLIAVLALLSHGRLVAQANHVEHDTLDRFGGVHTLHTEHALAKRRWSDSNRKAVVSGFSARQDHRGLHRSLRSAAHIPAGYRFYVSPGFGIEIYYTISGADSVDTTDRYGFAAANWRSRIDMPNGVPDYVDEVAWAMDSSWSMEVVRFGFPEPFGYVSSHYPGETFKMLIENLPPDYYGFTYPLGKKDEALPGFRCLPTIRTNWEGWDVNEIIDYESHPEEGIRVTCAHELFHAIQLAMVHECTNDIFLDTFPVAWTEATAVLMEELAFDSINDYIDYLGPFFEQPHLPLLTDDPSGLEWYTNSLVAHYLYRFASGKPDIAFIRELYESNLEQPREFHVLLEDAAVSAGTSWSELLGGFHSGSFFTGSRADTTLFIPDAPLLPRWSYVAGEGNAQAVISKTIMPWGMRTFPVLNDDSSPDPLAITCDVRASSAAGPTLAFNTLLRQAGDSTWTVQSQGTGDQDLYTFEIGEWSEYAEAIFVVSNADPTQWSEVSVSFGVDVGVQPRERGKAAPRAEPAAYVPSDRVDVFTVRGRAVALPLNCAGFRIPAARGGAAVRVLMRNPYGRLGIVVVRRSAQ